MDTPLSNERIADMSRVIHTWCIARTDTAQDADDLSQEILLTLLQALPNLRDEGAFYGFMWSVAGNVYRGWCRKRFARRECELPESLATEQAWPEDAPEDVFLLRRELTLLSRRYRQAAVLYYVRGMRVAQIAECMDVSQSMVKYLLFKARSILKEGMGMERNYGMQSYHPRRLSLRYWGEGPNHYYGACDSLIRQNIVFACYNDQLTAEQIALEVGVGLPYMEDDLRELTEIGILRQEGRRYQANIVIFTGIFAAEAQRLVQDNMRRIADLAKKCIEEKEEDIRALGFVGAQMNETAFRWQMASLLLHRAVISIAGSSAAPELPADNWGVHCVTWGVEEVENAREADFNFGASWMEDQRGDWVQCMDFPLNGDMVHHYLYRQAVANVFLAIARGEAEQLSENDEAIAAELVKRGYACRKEDKLTVNCPVYTDGQYKALLALVEPEARDIAEESLLLLRREAALLQEHVPVHLRKTAGQMAYFRLFEDAISEPMRLMWNERFLCDAKAADLLPTTYAMRY